MLAAGHRARRAATAGLRCVGQGALGWRRRCSTCWRRWASGVASSSTIRCCCDVAEPRRLRPACPASGTRSATSAADCCSRSTCSWSLKPQLLRARGRGRGGARVVRDGRRPGGCCSRCRCVLVRPGARRRARGAAAEAVARRAGANCARPVAALRSYRPVLWFLAAYWLYIDGVNTVIKMAVDYGLSLGFGPAEPDGGAAAHAVRRASRRRWRSAGSAGGSARAAASSSRCRVRAASPSAAYFIQTRA